MLVHIILMLYFSSEFIWMKLQFYCKVHFKLLHTSVMLRQIVCIPNAVCMVVRLLRAPCEPYSFICVCYKCIFNVMSIPDFTCCVYEKWYGSLLQG